MPSRVSLYALESELGAHRDTLERLCASKGIRVTREYNVRYIDRGDVLKLRNALHEFRRRVRPWGKAAQRPGGTYPVTGAGSPKAQSLEVSS